MPTLNERSVINLGQGSYVITLPKDWIRYFGIKLQVISNGELRIFPPKREGNEGNNKGDANVR
jgi:hypothetical protein